MDCLMAPTSIMSQSGSRPVKRGILPEQPRQVNDAPAASAIPTHWLQVLKGGLNLSIKYEGLSQPTNLNVPPE